MIQSKTITIGVDKEIHLDPVGDSLEVSIKHRESYTYGIDSKGHNLEQSRVVELERIRFTKKERLELVAALMGLDAEECKQREAA